MTPRSFPVSLGVTEAENKREARILIEHMDAQKRVVRESRRIQIHITDKTKTLGWIAEKARKLEYEGGAVKLEWLRDRDGIVYGISIVGAVR